LTLALEAHVRTAIDPSISRIGPNDGNDHEFCVPLLETGTDSYRLRASKKKTRNAPSIKEPPDQT
jgi:hypothetical protein